jgi:hypothetical protein
MDECIEVCPNDLDATILYSFYTAWSNANNKKIKIYPQFAKGLRDLGYDGYRDNIPGSNCGKKVACWCNLKIKSDVHEKYLQRIGQA